VAKEKEKKGGPTCARRAKSGMFNIRLLYVGIVTYDGEVWFLGIMKRDKHMLLLINTE
jgi:hypothetical protein